MSVLRRRRAVLSLALALLAAGTAVSANVMAREGDGDAPVAQTSLGGAELVAGPEGDVRSRLSAGAQLADIHLGGSRYNDLRAYDVRTGPDGTLYLLTGWSDCDFPERCYGFTARFDDHLVVESAISYADAYPGQLAI